MNIKRRSDFFDEALFLKRYFFVVEGFKVCLFCAAILVRHTPKSQASKYKSEAGGLSSRARDPATFFFFFLNN